MLRQARKWSPNTESFQMSGYRVFTRAHDLMVDASWLIEHPEFEPFAIGRSQRDSSPQTGTRLASEEELTESVSDAASIGSDLSNASVTILLDQSGSQRGLKRNYGIVAWADRVVEALTHLGAEIEVLGFTTQSWKGGKCRQEWLTAGKPAHPGRLNELLHIVYKPFEAPWNSASNECARGHLDFLYQEPYLREGFDGEAVEWATSRLADRSREHKMLLVMSDCAPVDDATLSVNPAEFLVEHLKSAVGSAEARGVKVIAISNGLFLLSNSIGAAAIYKRVAYESDRSAFCPRDAASAAVREITSIVEPKFSSVP